MGCITSKSALPTEPNLRNVNASAAVAATLPSYMTADPDLGWRNISDPHLSYPFLGFLADFQNERSTNTLTRMDLVKLAINIAERSGKLANRYGVTDPSSGGFQSSSNLLEDLAKQTGPSEYEGDNWTVNVDKDMKKILNSFGCPSFGWKLQARAYATAPIIRSHPEIFLCGDGLPGNTEDSLAPGGIRNKLSELAHIAEYLQLVEDGEGKLFLMDITEIAINIAEQLFRLEKAENTGHRVPDNSFGWKLMTPILGTNGLEGKAPREAFALPVSNPDGEALMLIPEELIMHVASWVQQTYLTAPAF